MHHKKKWLCAALITAAFSGVSDVVVVNKGYPGYNSRQALQLLENDVLPLRPDCAVVYFGMNDAVNSKNLVPLPEYRKNMEKIIQRLFAEGVKTVALVSLNPVITEYVQQRHGGHPQVNRLQDYLAEYNQVIRSLAEEHKLPLIDLQKIVMEHGGPIPSADCLLMCEANGPKNDGIHLTPAGYQLLGQEAFRVLRPFLKDGDKVVCFGDSLTFGVRVRGAGTVTGETYPAVFQRALNQPAQ